MGILPWRSTFYFNVRLMSTSNFVPVSYTHLDVYKRQMLSLVLTSAFGSTKDNIVVCTKLLVEIKLNKFEL